MRYDFSMEMDDLGRMEARGLALFERLQATPLKFCSVRFSDHVIVHATLEIEENHALRIEALLHRIEGVRSVIASPRASASQSKIAGKLRPPRAPTDRVDG